MNPPVKASLVLAMAAAFAAAPSGAADANPELQALRQELQTLRTAYEARLQALEQRLKSAEERAAAAASVATVPAAAASTAPVTAPTSSAVTSTAPLAMPAANAFNPELSLILAGQYSRSTRDPAQYRISGFSMPVGADIGPGTRGFSLAESELGLAANIDPWWRGTAHFALHGDNTVSVEEAHVQTTALGQGLTLKAGRFFSAVGYLNSQHAHSWDFADNPLAYQAMLGTQYGDDGVQLRWLAPTDRYLELAVELGRGRSFPGSDIGRNGAGMTALALHSGDDIGASHSWRAGVSLLNIHASEQTLTAVAASGESIERLFSGRTRVWIADAVWKWAPNGNATRTNFKLQGEYLHSTRNGSLSDAATQAGAAGLGSQSGWYLQGIYQFMPGWRVGLRSERLNPGAAAQGLAGNGYRPSKQSLMFDYNASEFSRWRVQLAQDRARENASDRQLIVQYQMSLGAHGAHSY